MDCDGDFVGDVERIRSYFEQEVSSARSLDLLKKIEATIQVVTFKAKGHRMIAEIASDLAECIRNVEAKKPIDPKGVLDQAIQGYLDRLQAVYARMKSKRAAAAQAEELREDDGVVEAYDDYLEGTTRLFDAMQEFASAVAEHDADLSPRTGKVYESAEDMLKDLLAE